MDEITGVFETGETSITAINIFVGLIVLILGRQLFWLFVGCLGFAVGFYYAPLVWNVQSHWLLLLLAGLSGVVGAVLALFFQKIAIGLAGFAGGGFVSLNLLYVMGIRVVDKLLWLPYLIGGILGILLLFFVFDWALILVSSLTGATIIVHAVNLTSGVEQILYFALVISGIIIQSYWFKKSQLAKK